MKFETTTGYGYIMDGEGRIQMKYDLPEGEHEFPEGSIVEVDSKEELDMIEVYKPEVEEVEEAESDEETSDKEVEESEETEE